MVRNTARARSIRGWICLICVSALLLSGCGTRMSKDKIEAADGTRLTAPTAEPSAVAPADAGGAPPLGVEGAGAAPGQPPKPGPATGPAAPVVTTPTSSAGPAPVKGPARAAPAGGTASCVRPLEPVVLGQTAPTSGIIGASMANLRSGLALWAKAVNAAGGVQCHPVRLIQMDDGADPARVVSNLNELVEARKAVAIVGIGIATTFPAARQYAERKQIPFIGGDLNEPGWFGSPWLFPQGGTPIAALAGATKEAAASVKATKVGLIYCVEASSCGVINENFEAMAAAAGLEVVLRKVTSITSPDYTSECQALKNAGAQVAFFALESSGDARAARSCAALGYTPPIATGALAVSQDASQDQNLRKLGVFLGTGNAPFSANDNAGTREFQAAINAYAAGSLVDQNSMLAWSSGKLLEVALARVAERARSGPITTALILEGLWQIRDEKLGGLAPGISFTKGGRPKQVDCYYALTITSAGYGAPAGSRLSCLRNLPLGVK